MGDGMKERNGFATLSPASIDLALDSISANDLEREVVHLVCRVNSPRSALRVVAEYRAARQESTQHMVRL